MQHSCTELVVTGAEPMHVDVERRLLLEELASLHDSVLLIEVERATEIELRLEEIGSSTASERARALLRNLGFTEPLMVC